MESINRMSLHADISPEALERLRKQRRNATISSVLIAGLSVVLVALILGIFLLPDLVQETPTIVTYESNLQEEPETEERKVQVSIDRKPAAPSSQMAKVIAANTTSPTAVPVPEVDVTTPSMDFGMSDDFGDGWGNEAGAGDGGGASFFNQKVQAKRLAYVIDYSQSMRGVRDKLMREELGKSISELGAGMQFQMIFFAGPVWVAGQEVIMQKGNRAATIKDGSRKYEWKSAGDPHSWNPDGKNQKPEWLTVSSGTLKAASKQIRETPLVWGTIWDHPLEMALSMDPKPDVIFFMTDGVAGGKSADIAKDIGRKARGMKVIINTVALMVPQAQQPLKELAKRSGGQFNIVKEGGVVQVVPLD